MAIETATTTTNIPNLYQACEDIQGGKFNGQKVTITLRNDAGTHTVNGSNVTVGIGFQGIGEKGYSAVSVDTPDSQHAKAVFPIHSIDKISSVPYSEGTPPTPILEPSSNIDLSLKFVPDTTVTIALKNGGGEFVGNGKNISYGYGASERVTCVVVQTPKAPPNLPEVIIPISSIHSISSSSAIDLKTDGRI